MTISQATDWIYYNGTKDRPLSVETDMRWHAMVKYIMREYDVETGLER